MSFSRARSALLVFATLAALLLGSCARSEAPGIQRLAVLRFENLTPDTAPEWIGRSLAEVITAELSAAGAVYAIPSSRLHSLNQTMGMRPVAAPGISAEAQMALARGANRIAYGEYAIVRGRIRARVSIEDPQKRRVLMEATADASDAIGAATALARQIDSRPRPYFTSSSAALEAFVRGVEAADPASARRYAEQALAADPDYGSAHILLAESAVKQQDRAGALEAIQAAISRGSAIASADRVRLQLLNATLRGDGPGVYSAMTELVKAVPLDPNAWRSLAEASVARRDYRQAVGAYTRALAIEPEDINAWNQLGYAAAYGGNVDAAMSALRRYRTLRPADVNPLDSMGDVNVLAGRLKEAEQFYLDAYRKNPSFLNGLDLFKGAMARLMTGDAAGANAILGDKADNADWMWLTGRRVEAFRKGASEIPKLADRDAQARGYAKLAVWALLLRDRDAAGAMAARAGELATPASAGTVAVSRFLVMPPAAAAEWRDRAAQMFPAGAPAVIRDSALAYALLLDRHFVEAAPVLQTVESRVGSDRSFAIELAWALIETGRFDDAAPLLRLNPVPGVDTATAFTGLYFPRLFQLRALLAERQGKTEEARENRRIFTALGGEAER